MNVDGRKYMLAYDAVAPIVLAHAARPSRFITGLCGASVNFHGRKYIFAYDAAATLVLAHAARPSRIIIGLSGWLSRSFLSISRSSAETCVGVRAQPQSSDTDCARSSSLQKLTGRKDDERNAVSHACDGMVVLGH